MAAGTIRAFVDYSKEAYAAHRRRTQQTKMQNYRIGEVDRPRAAKRRVVRPAENGSGGKPSRPPDPSVTDAVSALVNLGYRRSQAEAAIAAVARNPGNAGAVEQLISLGLKQLAKKI